MKTRFRQILSLFLVLMLTLSVFAACGGKKAADQVRVKLPPATDAEQAMNVTAALAVNSYLTARAYLDLFLACDTENLDEAGAAELTETLKSAIAAFENVDLLSEALTKATDVWENTKDDPKPVLASLCIRNVPFGLTAFAAGDTGATKWAQDIVDAYDKAPAGKGIRTLAAQLGTDAKHAYAQLKQALAVLEGAEYTAIADKANTAVQVASTLKTAGTAAGLVIAVAAAPAAGTLGAVVKTGGVVCSGINTLLEVGSTGSIIYNNGEENEISIACDKTEAQFAPIGQIFSVLGLGLALKDVGTTGKKILDSGYKSLSAKEMNDLGENSFGILSYAANSFNDYMNDGSILSGTFKKTDDGVDFTLIETLTGTEAEAADKVKEALKNAGIDEKTVESAFESTEEAKPDGNIPPEIAQKIIENNPTVTPAGGFDAESFIAKLEESLIEIAAKGDRDASSDETETETGTDAPAAEAQWVDPYEYFGVDDIVALYPLLYKAKPLKLEVTPICFDNNDRELIEFTNTGSFVIDMTKGAVTTYETSYVNGYNRYDLKVTLTGDPISSDLLRIRSDVDCYVAGTGAFDEHRENEECIIFNLTLDPYAPFADKAISFDNYTTATIAFRIDKALLAE